MLPVSSSAPWGVLSGAPEGRFCGEAAVAADIAFALSLNGGRAARARSPKRDATWIGGGNGTVERWTPPGWMATSLSVEEIAIPVGGAMINAALPSRQIVKGESHVAAVNINLENPVG